MVNALAQEKTQHPLGLEYPDAKSGELTRTGVGIKELTDAMDRDPFTGSPHHKSVRCRLVPVPVAAS